jgi:hypothetical protein
MSTHESGALCLCPLLRELTGVQAPPAQNGIILEDQRLGSPQVVTAELDAKMVRAVVELAEHLTTVPSLRRRGWRGRGL